MVHRQSWIADDWLGGIYPEVTECLRGNSDKQGIKPKGCIIRDIFRKASDFCQNKLTTLPAKHVTQTQGITGKLYFSSKNFANLIKLSYLCEKFLIY